jgi:CcmD family protein
MMGAWSFVGLAYGIVWVVILIYWFCLKRRYKETETGFRTSQGGGERFNDGKK